MLCATLTTTLQTIPDQVEKTRKYPAVLASWIVS